MELILAISTVVMTLATIVLVGVTAWYARTTAKILEGMQKDRRVSMLAAKAQAAMTLGASGKYLEISRKLAGKALKQAAELSGDEWTRGDTSVFKVEPDD